MLRKLLQPKSVDGIVAGFQKTLNALDDLQTRNAAIIEQREKHIEDAKTHIFDLTNEKNRARAIYSKIQCMIAG